MSTAIYLLGLLFTLVIGELQRPWLADMPLNRLPMVECHDSGSAYLENSDVVHNMIYAWTKTQSGNVTSQLECGCRSLDWRPTRTVRGIKFHHGGVLVDHMMESAAREVVAWANSKASQTEDDLVIIKHWDCTGGKSFCNSGSSTIYKQLGIPVVEGNECKRSFTVQEAMERSQLSGGGHVLVMLDCPNPPDYDHYNDQLSCNGFLDNTEGHQWEEDVLSCFNGMKKSSRLTAHEIKQLSDFNSVLSSNTRATDWSGIAQCLLGLAPDLFNASKHFTCYTKPGYLEDTYSDVPWTHILHWDAMHTAEKRSEAYQYSLMGNWAEDTISVALGFLHDSSILEDEVRSELNSRLADWVVDPTVFRFPPNWVSVNNVCNGGLELQRALLQRLDSQYTLGN